ncbi:MAG: hypothetical protein NVSMB38_27990 [Ktedonobacteraceae bacterium]
MKNAGRDSETLLPLTPAVFHILLALADSERHGYGIMLEVILHIDGKLRMGPETLYGSIKRMVSDGLIAESCERPDPHIGRRTPPLLSVNRVWATSSTIAACGTAQKSLARTGYGKWYCMSTQPLPQRRTTHSNYYSFGEFRSIISRALSRLSVQ